MISTGKVNHLQFHDQRVLIDLQRTELSRCRMIWLLPHPFPSPISKLSMFLSLPVELTDGRGGGREPNQTTARKLAWSSINHSILSGHDTEWILRSNPKLTITSPSVHSRVDSHGQPYDRVDLNPMPESALSPNEGLWELASGIQTFLCYW